MSLVKATVSGLIGGAIGGAVWAGLAYGVHREFAMVAWGIGALVGFCVQAGAGEKAGFTTGALAAIIALASIAGGKYAVIHIIVQKELAKFSAPIEAHLAQPMTDDEAVTSIAESLIDEAQEAGKTITWPKDKTAESDRNTIADYPAAIAKDAKARWKAMPAGDQQTFKDDTRAAEREAHKQFQAMAGAEAAKAGFLQAFDFFDLLFGLLAVATAFKLGSGGGSED